MLSSMNDTVIREGSVIAEKPIKSAPVQPPFFPSRNDPRIPFAAILTVYAVMGCAILGFNRTPLQILLTIIAGCTLEVLFHRIIKRRWLFPISAYISCVSLSLLLNYSHNYVLLFFPVFFTIASKYIFTFKGRHIFNPSLFGVVAALKLGGDMFASAPAYQWGGSPAMAAFMVTAALALFVFKIKRTALIVSFLAFYTIQLLVRAYIVRWHLPPETLIGGTLTSASFYLFTFFMLTDPKTSPEGKWAQVGWSLAVVLLDAWFHTRQSLSTLFLALFWLSAARWAFLHCRELSQTGLVHLRQSIWTRSFATAAILVGLIGWTGYSLYGTVIHPRIVVSKPTFRFEPVPPAASGIDSELGNVLQQIDSRIQHFGKWLTSVGDAIAVGDYDDDGLLDIFLTNPLKRAEDRNALYRNRGGFRFERVPVPCLDVISSDPAKHGLMAGALFVDYDNSGRQSLLLCGAYGKSRLLKNSVNAKGEPEFTDVTDASGVSEHTVSVAATWLDFDRDGRLDLLLANSLTPYLPGYAQPQPLNIFQLPTAEHPKDRRMFRFMHESWHKATNGGQNVFFKNEGDRFVAMEGTKIGMPETHITIAVGTGDLNHDGFTDIYAANDFGPDDLYLNDRGRGFIRVQGNMFGSIGRDTYKGMNVSIADFDNRGWQDIYVSNVHVPLQAEGSLLWKTFPNPKNPTIPLFDDQATRRGVLNEHRFGWGAAAGDLDLDGWLDIVQANGMVDDTPDKRFDPPRQYWYSAEKIMRSGPEIHAYVDRWPDLRGYEIFGRQADRVYLSQGNRKITQFVDVAAQVGITNLGNSRGIALADFDNDGRLDMAITHQFKPLSLYRNVAPGKQPRWLGLWLEGDGKQISREAVGTTVFVRHHIGGEPIQQMREVQIANGFSAQHDRRLLFGLGDYDGPVTVEVRWYGGPTEIISGLSLNRYHRLVYTPKPESYTRN